jgi:hypothetical protein
MHSKKTKSPLRKAQEQLLHSWWVLAFLVAIYCLGLKSFDHKEKSILQLQSHVGFLLDQKRVALGKKQELEKQIASQTDPAYIEMILMKKLGVVPEGNVKICFKKSSEDALSFYEEL